MQRFVVHVICLLICKASRKGRTGKQKGQDRGGGWVHPKGANSKAMSVLLSFGKSLVGTGWAISLVLGGGGGCT